jgi:hypothetical protein
MARQSKLREVILACLRVVLDVITMDMSGTCPLRRWQIGFRCLALDVPVETSGLCLYHLLALEGGVAGDFAVAEDGKKERR